MGVPITVPEQFPEQVGIVAFPLFPVPIPRSLKVRENMLSDALLGKGVQKNIWLRRRPPATLVPVPVPCSTKAPYGNAPFPFPFP